MCHSDVESLEGKPVNSHQIKNPNVPMVRSPRAAVVSRASPTLGSCATEARSPRLVSMRMARGTCPEATIEAKAHVVR